MKDSYSPKGLRIKRARESLALFLIATDCSFRYDNGDFIIENNSNILGFRRFCKVNGVDSQEVNKWKMEVVLIDTEIKKL